MLSNSIRLNQIRRISQAAFEKLKVVPQDRLVWKAEEDDPRKHTSLHEGLFYQLPKDESTLIKIFGEASPFNSVSAKHYKTLGIMPLMVRQPALTALDYLKRLNYSSPNVRMLFYGDYGHGKSHTIAHLLHYTQLMQEHVVLHVRQMRKFTRSPFDISESTTRPGRIDTPLNSAMQLQQFKVQNFDLLEKYKDTLVSSQDYKWSQREITKAGDPLVNIVEHGINRVNHASDCLAVLIKELILAADEGKIKLASFLDDISFLFSYEAGILKHNDFKKVLVDEITVARAIKKLIKGTQKNSVVLATCDDGSLSKKQNLTPREVLGLDGWSDFDPCLPIHVPKYSRKEFESCMNFYQDIGWLCRPESRTVQVRDEIRFVSGLNPQQVEYLCQSL